MVRESSLAMGTLCGRHLPDQALWYLLCGKNMLIATLK
jgi:hypothetical protein